VRFQDKDGPLLTGGVFHNGRLVAEAPSDVTQAFRDEMNRQYPGSEVLACCNAHPDTAAVDCLICWPLDEEG
jgi:hypothetical protein